MLRPKTLHLPQNSTLHLHLHLHLHLFQQHRNLVNLKPKWVKDRTLDRAITREKHLLQILHLISTHFPNPTQAIHAHSLTHPPLLDPTRFLLRFPAIFTQISPTSFTLSPAAINTRLDHLNILKLNETNFITRIKKLLMLTINQELPLHTLDLLAFDLGLDLDYKDALLLRYMKVFDLFKPDGDERIWIRLVSKWDPLLAVSEMERHGGNAFPVRFTRGFGLRKKCVEWLREWQELEYVSPYDREGFGMDLRTDVAEKRMVGVFHEILWLTVGKKTERKNVSNMRRVLGLPYKFTKVFERHPGIFYLSRKLGRETVVLREGYGGGREVLMKHPIGEVRDKYLELMRVSREDLESDDDVDENDC